MYILINKCAGSMLRFFMSIIQTDNAGDCNSSFIEEPKTQVITAGQTAQFHCRHSAANQITWRINGSSISNSNLRNISMKSMPLTDGHARYILNIEGVVTYNGTHVVCVAVFTSGVCTTKESNNMVVLLIQGKYNYFFYHQNVHYRF